MDDYKSHEIPGRVSIFPGQGELPVIRVEADASEAEIYLLGAHVTRFQKKGEAPLLFMSAASEFRPATPIRGGVPIVFPWFGPREGMAPHGFARVTDWRLLETAALPDGSVRIHLRLPGQEGIVVDYIVTVGMELTLELVVSVPNEGTSYTFENCLHTYFEIGAIDRLGVAGLEGTTYLDKVLDRTAVEENDIIRISSEVDRVYRDTETSIEISDPALGRAILVRKSGSKSTVLWNPWIEKSRRMPDFGDDEYLRMVCVESGNVGDNAITLAPGGRSALKVTLSSAPLA